MHKAYGESYLPLVLPHTLYLRTLAWLQPLPTRDICDIACALSPVTLLLSLHLVATATPHT